MKMILAALFAVLIGLTFAGATFAAEGSKTGTPVSTAATGGGMKKDGGQKIMKASKKHHRKKQHEAK